MEKEDGLHEARSDKEGKEKEENSATAAHTAPAGASEEPQTRKPKSKSEAKPKEMGGLVVNGSRNLYFSRSANNGAKTTRTVKLLILLNQRYGTVVMMCMIHRILPQEFLQKTMAPKIRETVLQCPSSQY